MVPDSSDDTAEDEEHAPSVREDRSRHLPEDFPVALAVYDENNRLRYTNAAFRDFFYDGVKDEDIFRRRHEPEYVLNALTGQCPRERYQEDDKNRFGRIDFFLDWSVDGVPEQPLKLGYPRIYDGEPEEGTPEYRAAMDAVYKDERYFRYWTKKRSTPDEDGLALYIFAAVDLTDLESQRRTIVEAERRFAEKLSATLIDERLKDGESFRMVARPRNGPERAGGDFLFFWATRGDGGDGEKDYFVAVIGDSAEKSLIAASDVQQIASILVPYCKMPPRSFFRATNPAEALIKYLNDVFISSRVLTNLGIDGIVLVIDAAANTVYYANGKQSAFQIGRKGPPSAQEFGRIALEGEERAQLGPTIGLSTGAAFRCGSLTVDDDDIILGMTDGVRNRLLKQHGEDRFGAQLALIARRAINLAQHQGDADADPAETDAPDRSSPEAAAMLNIVEQICPDDTANETQDDDELVVGISIRGLRNVSLS